MTRFGREALWPSREPVAQPGPEQAEATAWSVSTVDDAAWKRLREQLRSDYENLRKAIASHASGSAESYGGSVAAVAHAAYHLGAIRQKVAASRHG